MIQKVFALYDSKAEAYCQPFMMQAPGQAIRAVAELASNLETSVGKHPADFTLFQIAEYDDSTGRYKQLDAHINLGNALEMRNPVDLPTMTKHTIDALRAAAN